MAFDVALADLAQGELHSIRKYDARRIEDEIEKQLRQQPTVETRNRKPLGEPSAGFEYVPPLWELRVGLHRVYYDVDGEACVVTIRAIRRKGPRQTTEEVLQ